MAAVATRSALVHNARSAACSAHGMLEDSWSQMSSTKIMKRVGEMIPPRGTHSLIFTEELICPLSLTRAVLSHLWNK